MLRLSYDSRIVKLDGSQKPASPSGENANVEYLTADPHIFFTCEPSTADSVLQYQLVECTVQDWEQGYLQLIHLCTLVS
ncbi:hypothetical protein M758_1G321400 [Ceratodon purpureus]|uniref:Uncharacterized protein n=1 Tax=Ceratodon purpureus TaxID=3225 RepID=A0A8T0JEA1_CERPU|nr:hypothetical protein KC19_1G328700 [Ceratodon purpureus]KAG0632346.1 hypothetical protein M758_1G321400 [Ceratodon purpureus]